VVIVANSSLIIFRWQSYELSVLADVNYFTCSSRKCLNNVKRQFKNYIYFKYFDRYQKRRRLWPLVRLSQNAITGPANDK